MIYAETVELEQDLTIMSFMVMRSCTAEKALKMLGIQPSQEYAFFLSGTLNDQERNVSETFNYQLSRLRYNCRNKTLDLKKVDPESLAEDILNDTFYLSKTDKILFDALAITFGYKQQIIYLVGELKNE